MIYFELLWTFLKIGAFTFGGGYAMLPLIEEQVLLHGWLSAQEIVNFIAVSESTPGPFAINIATYVGSQVAGVLGSACATLGVVLPSFVIILMVARFFVKFKDNRAVTGVMAGLKPAVIGLIGSAIVSMAATVFLPTGFNTSIFTSVTFYISLAIFALSAILAFTKKHPILIICVSALLGIIFGFIFEL